MDTTALVIDRRVRPAWRDRRHERATPLDLAGREYVRRSPGRRRTDLIGLDGNGNGAAA